MTGKEALRILCECANGEKKLLFSDSLDLGQIVSKRLEKLEKLERAFEILKDEFKVEIERDFYETHIEYNVVLRHRGDNYGIFIDELTKEEAELLEELMKSE